MFNGRFKVRGRRRRRTASIAYIYIPVFIILAVLLCIFAIILFFGAAKLQVEGSTSYTEDEIIDSSGIEMGDNLMFMNESAAVAKIKATLPRVDTVQLVKHMPNVLTIRVTESKSTAYIKYGVDNWVIDQHGKLLNTTESTAGMLNIKGIELVDPVEGQIISAESDASVHSLVQVLEGLVDADLLSKSADLDMSNVGNITFRYDDRFNVKLGTSEDIENKLKSLCEIAESRQINETGTIDLSYEGRGSFVPE
ncbi:MAG: FtsQ-type POTRA domain-containing protein [Oscillospiraceae bacterium]|nr:FtsQ-type POTRA domain-containing protein [Oscillospiraceae bacterium]